MTTAIDIIEESLKLIEVISAEIPIESSMARDALTALNDLGVEWEPDYSLGFTPALIPADSIGIPRFAPSVW